MATPVTNSTAFSPDDYRRFFASRLSCSFNGHAQQTVRCPFHSDSHASLSVNWDKGVWSCKAGCGEGGILDFEEKFSRCDRETARTNVAELLGHGSGPSVNGRSPEAIYEYPDETGKLIFRKLRYPGKQFVCQQPGAGDEHWIYSLRGIEDKPLYRSPELVRSTYAIVVEGEKDADRLTSLNLSQFDPAGLPVAITCNFDGAGPGKWRPEYGKYFAGKQVTVIPDNDGPGHEHGEAIAAGVYPYAAGVKIVHLSGLGPGGDASDWLNQGHSAADLVSEIEKTRRWEPLPQRQSSRFRTIAEIVAQSTEKADWILPHYVERTATTEITGKIKEGKTTFVLSACKAVVEGSPFLGQQPTRGPVVMVTEQGGASLNEGLKRAGLFGHADVTIMRPCDAFGLNWTGVMDAAVKECERVHAVLLLIDTLNGLAQLRGDDENSAGRMLEIMRPLQAAAGKGWGIWVSAHERKSGGTVGDAARGSSAAGGVFDILMSLRRPAGNHHSDTIRKISSISRFDQTPAELVVDWRPGLDGSDGCYVIVGESDAVSLDRATRAIMRALPAVESAAKTLAVLVAETGEKRTTIQRVLKQLSVPFLGDGEKGNPLRYYLRTAGGAQ